MIQLYWLFQKVIGMDTLSRTHKVSRSELYSVPELLQEVLQLLFSDIINIYRNRIQFMCVLLRVCLAIERDRRYQSELVPYDLIKHIQTIIYNPLLRSSLSRWSYLGCNQISFSVMLCTLQAPLWEQVTIELMGADLWKTSLQHQLLFIPIYLSPLIHCFCISTHIFLLLRYII